jgi:hypothetical protein
LVIQVQGGEARPEPSPARVEPYDWAHQWHSWRTSLTWSLDPGPPLVPRGLTWGWGGVVIQVEVVEERPRSFPAKVEPYDWARQWYPVAYIADLDPGRPHSVELLGQRLVVWRDNTATWRCFKDRCPHRLAPLSGNLLVWPRLFVIWSGCCVQ